MEDDTQAELQKTKLKKVQEKNKRAQARYRQKQKEKMVGFEERCHLLTEELEALKLAYAKVEEEKAALEMALKNSAMFLAPPGHHKADDHQRAVHADSSSPMPVRPVPQPSSGWAGYLVEQAYYNNVMRDVIAKSLGEAQAAEADNKPFEYMPPDAVITLFASLVEELRERLKVAEEQKTVDAHRPVIDIVQAMRTLGQTYRDRQSKQQNISDSLATRSTLFSKYGAPSMDVWKAVLEAANLSPTQLNRILEFRTDYLSKLDAHVRDRKEVVWQLQQATALCETAPKQTECFGKAVKLTEQLQESLTREYSIHEEFHKNVTRHALTEIQEARMTVTAHPYHLDIAAICDVLMMRPDGSAPACLSMDHTELARNLPSLPAILQIPAVLDSDSQMAQDMYRHAMVSWSNAEKNRQPDNSSSRPMLGAFQPAPSRPQPSQPFQASMGLSFNGGGRGSGFMPMNRQASSHPKDGF